jgi:hypothetical protein
MKTHSYCLRRSRPSIGRLSVRNILFRTVVDQAPVLKLRVMTASLPLQGFRSVLNLVAGRTFRDDRHYLRFRHSGLKFGKPIIHLTADAHQKREGY